jgi:hypothetical protein
MGDAAHHDGRRGKGFPARFVDAADGGTVAWDDDHEPDATRALPKYRRHRPDSIRYASSGAISSMMATGASGATSGGGAHDGTGASGRSEAADDGWMPRGNGAFRGGGVPGGSEPASRQAQNSVWRGTGMSAGEFGTPEWHSMPGQDEPPGQLGVPAGEYGMPDQYEAPENGSGWPADRAGAAWPLPEPQPGWFGRHNPDLWLLGAGVFVAGTALVAAFAAASGGTATGYSQTPQTTATHATAKNPQAARAGVAPIARPACVSPAITASGR